MNALMPLARSRASEVSQPRERSMTEGDLSNMGKRSAPGSATTRRHSRGRTRDGVLDAACQLLVTQGLGALTIDAVAQSAGIDMAVISRWWPSEEALAFDALRREWLALAIRMRHGAVRVNP